MAHSELQDVKGCACSGFGGSDITESPTPPDADSYPGLARAAATKASVGNAPEACKQAAGAIRENAENLCALIEICNDSGTKAQMDACAIVGERMGVDFDTSPEMAPEAPSVRSKNKRSLSH